MYNSTREYEACVLVNGKPVTEVTHNGRTYIEGRKNSVYELRFTNSSLNRILIIPSVDGLNVVDGKPCGKESQGYVLNAFGSITIPGWTVDGHTAAKFMFKTQNAKNRKDENYVEAIGENPENQGVIGFMIFEEMRHPIVRTFRSPSPTPWEPFKKYTFSNSVDEGIVYGSSSNCVSTSSCSADLPHNVYDTNQVQDEDESLGTAFGQATHFETTITTFRKASNEPKAVFTFFYDTLKNLGRMGVPVNRFRRKHRRRPCGPNPFPKSPELWEQGCRIPQGWKK